MKKTVHLIYFSPTETSKKIALAIASGFEGHEVLQYDLSRPDAYLDMRILDGIAVFAFPVYGGRVPKVAMERMMELSGSGVPAVIAVIYGNRAYEDALVELRDIVTRRGFIPVAGGAFIGEHSYADAEHPIALGRPDGQDIGDAAAFGKKAFVKIFMEDMTVPEMDGNVPYKELALAKGVTPATRDTCVACGACARVCPTSAIKVGSRAESAGERCIMCMACAKQCPKSARFIDNPMLLERIDMLAKSCAERKNPSVFI